MSMSDQGSSKDYLLKAKEYLTSESQPSFRYGLVSMEQMLGNLAMRETAISEFNDAVTQYEQDLADFQSQMIEKAQNWIDIKYYKETPAEYAFEQHLYPPLAPIPSVYALLTPETIDD